MKIKHKLLIDYQYTSLDKKIFLIKSGTIIDDYVYNLKGESLKLDREIVEANPQIFTPIDWKAELLTYMRTQKLPTPSQFHKKLVPFIEEMVLSSIQQNTPTVTFEESKIREIEWKEKDLNIRERRIKDTEDEIEIRVKRVEKRESDYKNEIQELDKKEDDLRLRSRELIEKQIDLEDIESKSAELKRRENKLLELEFDLEEVKKYLLIKIEEINLEESSLMKLDQEIKDWESSHWKFKRESIPPSAIPESVSDQLRIQLGLGGIADTWT